MIQMNFETFYHLILIPPTIIAVIDAFRHAPDFHFSRLRGAFYAALMVALGFWGVYLGADFYNLFRVARGQNASQRLAIYGSIFVFIIGSYLVIMLEKGIRALLRRVHLNVPDVNLRDTWDMLEPGAFIFIMFTKFRCLWAGCCYGFPCSWGIHYSHIEGTYFPVQICEICMTFSIVLIVSHLKRKPFYRRGMALFLAAIMFSSGRFFLEYLMYYPPEDRTYLGIFTFWQCASILVVLICVAVLTFLYKTQPSEPMPPGALYKLEQKIDKVFRRVFPKSTPKKHHGGEWQSTKKKYKKKKKT